MIVSSTVDRVGERQAALLHPIAKRAAVESLHHEVAAAIGERAEREDVDDVRVADLIDRPRLLHEALDRLAVHAQRRM